MEFSLYLTSLRASSPLSLLLNVTFLSSLPLSLLILPSSLSAPSLFSFFFLYSHSNVVLIFVLKSISRAINLWTVIDI